MLGQSLHGELKVLPISLTLQLEILTDGNILPMANIFAVTLNGLASYANINMLKDCIYS